MLYPMAAAAAQLAAALRNRDKSAAADAMTLQAGDPTAGMPGGAPAPPQQGGDPAQAAQQQQAPPQAADPSQGMGQESAQLVQMIIDGVSAKMAGGGAGGVAGAVAKAEKPEIALLKHALQTINAGMSKHTYLLGKLCEQAGIAVDASVFADDMQNNAHLFSQHGPGGANDPAAQHAHHQQQPQQDPQQAAPQDPNAGAMKAGELDALRDLVDDMSGRRKTAAFRARFMQRGAELRNGRNGVSL